MSIKRLVIIVVFTCAGFWSTLVFIDRGFLVNLGKHEVDFACYYSAALAARWGYPMHNSGPYALLQPNVLRHIWKSEDGKHAKPENVYLYPALLAYSLVPLTFLAYSTAEWIWNLACLVAYGCGVYLLIRCVGLSGWRSSVWVVLLVILSLRWPPLLISVQHGQVVPWVFLLLVLCLWGTLRKRPYVAGVSLGLATALKIGPMIYLPYLIMLKRWRTAGIAVVTFLILLCVGPGHNERLFRWVLPHARLGSTLVSNQCVAGVLCRAQSERRERWITPEGYEEIRGALRIASWIGALALALVLFGVRTCNGAPDRMITSFVLISMTLAVFSPLSRVTEYTYGLFGLGVLLKWWLESDLRTRILLGGPLILVIWLAVFDLGGTLARSIESGWASWLSINATFIWGLLLWLMLVADLFLRKESQSRSNDSPLSDAS